MTPRQKKEKFVQFRLTEFDYGRLKMLANRYAGGNASQWILHGIWNAPRVKLEPKKPSPRK